MGLIVVVGAGVVVVASVVGLPVPASPGEKLELRISHQHRLSRSVYIRN